MSDLIIPSRRNFIIGATLSLISAPAIVKASNLMAIKPFEVLAAIGMEVPIDLEMIDYLVQYQRFQKGFLAEYRKESDPVPAKVFSVETFGSKWAGDLIQKQPTFGRALADDGPYKQRIEAEESLWGVPAGAAGYEAHRDRLTFILKDGARKSAEQDDNPFYRERARSMFDALADVPDPFDV